MFQNNSFTFIVKLMIATHTKTLCFLSLSHYSGMNSLFKKTSSNQSTPLIILRYETAHRCLGPITLEAA